MSSGSSILKFHSIIVTYAYVRAVGSNLKVGRPDNVISNSVAAGGFVQLATYLHSLQRQLILPFYSYSLMICSYIIQV